MPAGRGEGEQGTQLVKRMLGLQEMLMVGVSGNMHPQGGADRANMQAWTTAKPCPSSCLKWTPVSTKVGNRPLGKRTHKRHQKRQPNLI